MTGENKHHKSFAVSSGNEYFCQIWCVYLLLLKSKVKDVSSQNKLGEEFSDFYWAYRYVCLWTYQTFSVKTSFSGRRVEWSSGQSEPNQGWSIEVRFSNRAGSPQLDVNFPFSELMSLNSLDFVPPGGLQKVENIALKFSTLIGLIWQVDKIKALQSMKFENPGL